jgi:hypothetical protein
MAQKRQSKKNPAAVSLGKLGGKKGGPARAAKLTSEERREIARKAGKAGAAARWGSAKAAKKTSQKEREQ